MRSRGRERFSTARRAPVIVRRLLRALSRAAPAALVAAALARPLPPQQPAPLADGSPAASWLHDGRERLEAEDPLGAWNAYRRAVAISGVTVPAQVGLGRTQLMLGESALALAWAEAALRGEPGNEECMALCVRALIRGRQFDVAVQRAASFVARTPGAGADLCAAEASALFRVQRIPDAANAYRRVVGADPLHAEAHLRLGSGLLPPSVVAIPDALRRAVAALDAGDLAAAVGLLRGVLQHAPDHPVAHRLLGETLFAQKTASSMAASDPAFAALAAAMPAADVRALPVAQFVAGYEKLAPARRRVVDRTAAMFAQQLGKLVAVGGRHDLLRELERTTDAAARASLRGKRTFDGRVWDDVRGVGGVQAATGIEALDEAATFGFDTLAHEVAHQVHYFTFSPLQRARIRSLYNKALADQRCLDYYAASNEAEYFGQGVEAFASLGKRPGSETTHGHTRWELYRVDRDLHDFIAEVVDFDPLAVPARREQVLAASVAVALRVGRPVDAAVAAGMMAPGPARERALADAARAMIASRCW